MQTVIGIKNCDTMQKAFKWLGATSVEWELRDVKVNPLSKDEIVRVLDVFGLDVAVNKRGTTYRKLGLHQKTVSLEEIISLVAENQTLLKRPIILNENRALIGFDEQIWSASFGF